MDKLKNASCIITNHHYTPRYNQEKRSGLYCVQFMFFKNNYFGNRILNNWRNKCLRWCFDKVENNKFGDQKYLDSWKRDFSGVYETKMLGAGVAPWNLNNYRLGMGESGPTVDGEKIIFFHFHGLKFAYIGRWIWLYFMAPGYLLEQNPNREIYRIYLKYLTKNIDLFGITASRSMSPGWTLRNMTKSKLHAYFPRFP
jgi:hypothetical protein